MWKPQENHDSWRLDLKQVCTHSPTGRSVYKFSLSDFEWPIRRVNLFLFFHLQRQKAVATAKPNYILWVWPTFPKYGQQILGLKNNTFILVIQRMMMFYIYQHWKFIKKKHTPDNKIYSVLSNCPVCLCLYGLFSQQLQHATCRFRLTRRQASNLMLTYLVFVTPKQ